MYTTSDVAKKINIHPNTVRLYEQLDLITKPERLPNGYRIFTDLHILQFMLARLAFQVEIIQEGLRKDIIEIVKTTAKCNFDKAIKLSYQYLKRVYHEEKLAQEAILVVDTILKEDQNDTELSLTRKETSNLLNITIDTLRNWEMNGLIKIKRKENGYRVYDFKDIQRLKIIRTLKMANYSLQAILRMLNQLDENPNTDILSALSTHNSADIVTACDILLVSLKTAELNTYKMIILLKSMKMQF